MITMTENIETTIVDGKRHEVHHIPPVGINLSSFRPIIDKGKDKGKVRYYQRSTSYGGGRVRGKPEIEVQEDYAFKDWDEPEKDVLEIFIKHRQEERTNMFQVIRYKIGIIKHVDCKTKNCENQWRYTDTEPFSEKFDFDDSHGYKIKCLLCGATCDTHKYHPPIRVFDASGSIATE